MIKMKMILKMIKNRTMRINQNPKIKNKKRRKERVLYRKKSK